MNRYDPFERDVTAWLGDTAAPRMPDFRDDLLRQTATTRQRPPWSFPETWLPMTAVSAGRRTIRTVPWKTVALLALLILTLTAAAVLFAGSRVRAAPVLGPAANGLVAYGADGDIYTVDPSTGARQAVIADETRDHAPRFSLDGTRMLFLRGDGKTDVPVIADVDGRNQIVANTPGLTNISPYSIVWSPDGRTIALLAELRGRATIYLVDAIDGRVTVPPIKYLDGEINWRPPDGRAFMFTRGWDRDEELALYSLDTGNVKTLVPAGKRAQYRGQGWSADGTRFTYHQDIATRATTQVVDVDTGRTHELPLAFGELSNDGRRVVGLDGLTGGLCVTPVDVASCTPITPPYADLWGWDFRWSPDDSAILTHRYGDDAQFVLDPDGGPVQTQPPWMAQGGESWQRRAP